MTATASALHLPPRQQSRFWRRFRRHRLAVVGTGFMLILICLALFAPFLATHDPYELDMRATKEPPNAEYLLGTDTAGRDMWSRLIYAGRISLSVGIVSVTIYITIGTILGAVAAYYGGWVDSLIMRFTDTVMSFPDLIIIITVVAFIGPSIYNVMLAIGLLGWPGTCRLVRGQVLALREIEFIEAAHSTGLPTGRILWRHLLPNVVPYLIVVATLGMAGAILTEAGLSFLGLGVQPPTPSWGNMLNSAQRLTLLEQYPHLWLSPGLMIAVTVLSINFIGDALRDALDPRLTL
ncbi:MAG: ABC transporter permease [Caldilineaceae bacterium]|nr:ABC transporter permease [Caldilineaceae bacterium]